MKSGMSLRLTVSLLSLWVTTVRAKVTEGPWLTNGAPLPKNGLRVTTLGSGTPDVRKDQVSSGFLLELGNGDKFICDLGTGAYQNLLVTGIPAAQLTKVIKLSGIIVVANLVMLSFFASYQFLLSLPHSHMLSKPTG